MIKNGNATDDKCAAMLRYNEMLCPSHDLHIFSTCIFSYATELVENLFYDKTILSSDKS